MSSVSDIDSSSGPERMQVLTVAIYALISAIGTCGNALVVFVVLRKRSMRTITNMFITNLAISDIVMSTVNVPLTPTAMFMKNWTLPSAVCKLMPMTMGVSVYVSTLTSTAIAVDRYFVIVHPFVPRMKTSLCLVIVLVVWIVASLISTPIAVFQKVKVSENGSQISCVEDWKMEYRPVFTIISFVLQFLIPGSVITACYVKVSISLSNRYKNNTLAKKSRAKEELDIRRKRRTNRMLIAMVAIFVVCWIPLNLLWMVNDISMLSELVFKRTFIVCHVLAMSSVMYNPLLYGWMNANFQNEFRSLMPACLAPKRQTGRAGVSDSRGNTSYRYSTVDKNRRTSGERQQTNGEAINEVDEALMVDSREEAARDEEEEEEKQQQQQRQQEEEQEEEEKEKKWSE